MSLLTKNLQAIVDARLTAAIGDPAPRRIMLLDAPDHQNVGDLAILLGQLAFLARAWPEARIGVASAHTYQDALDRDIAAADLILLHGGGNFGDIWRHHHDLKLRVLERFPQKRIVQFPQSIHFRDADNLSKTRRAIAQARNYQLLVRDTRSLAFAQDNFDCAVTLCPDMAFAMGPLDGGEATLDYACLLRTDKEILEEKREAVRAILSASGASWASDDWLRGQTGLNWGLERAHGVSRRLLNLGLPAPLLARNALPIYRLYAQSRLRFGLAMLGRGRTVVTDRLHGFILATLIDRPRVVFDSLDGKVHAFHATWLAEDPGVRIVRSVEEFRDWIAGAGPSRPSDGQAAVERVSPA